MRHYHALVCNRNPIGDIEFVRLGIIKASNLFGQQVDHEGIEVEAFWKKPKCLGAALACVPLRRIFLIVHFLNDVREGRYDQAYRRTSKAFQSYVSVADFPGWLKRSREFADAGGSPGVRRIGGTGRQQVLR